MGRILRTVNVAVAFAAALFVGCQSRVEPAYQSEAIASLKPAAASPLTTSASPDQGPPHEDIEVSLGVPTKDQVVAIAAAVIPRRARPGDTVTLKIRARIAPGWHIFAAREAQTSRATPTDTLLDLELPEGIQPQDDWTLPPAATLKGPLGSAAVYEGDITFIRELHISSNCPRGRLNIGCRVTYQACNDILCQRPTPAEIRIPVEVDE